MLQPFEIFKLFHLEKLLEMNRRWLVSQSYFRGQEIYADEPKTSILFTDYDNYDTARTHWNAVRHDKFAAVIDLHNEKHKNKISQMLGTHSTYTVFWAVVRSVEELEQRVNEKYKENVRRYIKSNTSWEPGGNGLAPSIQVIFGEIYIILKFKKEILKVKFEEIERS